MAQSISPTGRFSDVLEATKVLIQEFQFVVTKHLELYSGVAATVPSLDLSKDPTTASLLVSIRANCTTMQQYASELGIDSPAGPVLKWLFYLASTAKMENLAEIQQTVEVVRHLSHVELRNPADIIGTDLHARLIGASDRLPKEPRSFTVEGTGPDDSIDKGVLIQEGEAQIVAITKRASGDPGTSFAESTLIKVKKDLVGAAAEAILRFDKSLVESKDETLSFLKTILPFGLISDLSLSFNRLLGFYSELQALLASNGAADLKESPLYAVIISFVRSLMKLEMFLEEALKSSCVKHMTVDEINATGDLRAIIRAIVVKDALFTFEHTTLFSRHYHQSLMFILTFVPSKLAQFLRVCAGKLPILSMAPASKSSTDNTLSITASALIDYKIMKDKGASVHDLLDHAHTVLTPLLGHPFDTRSALSIFSTLIGKDDKTESSSSTSLYQTATLRVCLAALWADVFWSQAGVLRDKIFERASDSEKLLLSECYEYMLNFEIGLPPYMAIRGVGMLVEKHLKLRN